MNSGELIHNPRGEFEFMNSRDIATASIFAALTVVLNLSPFKIPAPYAPFLYYQIWEIPIVTVFILYGPSMAVAVSVINTLALLVLFPGALPTGPLYNLAAVLGMLVGIYIAHLMTKRRPPNENFTKLSLLATGLGIFFRVTVMTSVNWAFIRYPPPVGFSMPEEAILAILPLVAFFNATLALYTIPAGYILARAVSSGVKIGLWKPS